MACSADLFEKTVYLVRHGESTGNVAQKLFKADEDTLTDRGISQARELGKFFNNIDFTRVYASKYDRAIRTAQEILKGQVESNGGSRSMVEVTVDKRLNEIDYGEKTGKGYKEVYTYCRSISDNPFDWYFPNGESFSASGQRIDNFFKELCEDVVKSTCGEKVLVVTHSVALVNFLSLLPTYYKVSNWDTKSDLKVMNNSSYMEIVVKDRDEDASSFHLEFRAKHASTLMSHLPSNGTAGQRQFCCSEDDKVCTSSSSSNEETGDMVGVRAFAKEAEGGKQYGNCVQQ